MKRGSCPLLKTARILGCFLLCGVLLFSLISCKKAESSSEASEAAVQPDSAHPVVWSQNVLVIENYDAQYISYQTDSRQLYLALSKENALLAGLPNEAVEGGASHTADDTLEIGFTAERPHDGGTLEGVRIHFTYDMAGDSVSDIRVEDFTGTDGTVYTIDYTEQAALADGRLLSEVVRTFEEYHASN